jgi:Putative MetA-pathway of phenol degradation
VPAGRSDSAHSPEDKHAAVIPIARAVVLALILVSPLGLASRSTASDEETRISPDRPTVSNNADIVPPGALQLEAGLVYQQERFAARPTERRFSFEGTLRVGLLETLEVRLFGEPFVALRGEDNPTGQGDFGLSLKCRLLGAPEGTAWPALAVQPLVIFPTGKDHILSDRTSFGLIGIASADLPAALHVDANAGIIAVGQKDPSGFLPQGLVSAVLSWAALERLSLWGEVFFFSPAQRGGRSQLGLDAGLMYFVTNRLALDFAVFTTVAGAGPDFALRTGFSVLFGR